MNKRLQFFASKGQRNNMNEKDKKNVVFGDLSITFEKRLKLWLKTIQKSIQIWPKSIHEIDKKTGDLDCPDGQYAIYNCPEFQC